MIFIVSSHLVSTALCRRYRMPWSAETLEARKPDLKLISTMRFTLSKVSKS